SRHRVRDSGRSHHSGRSTIRTHITLLCLCIPGPLFISSCRNGCARRIPKPRGRHDRRTSGRTQGGSMTKVSRRKLITTGLGAGVGASGIAVAANLARRYGLIPPDAGGIFGPGEALTYAAQRLLTRHAPAREFGRSQISKPPFANEVAPLGEPFKRLQEGAFAD